MTLLRFENVCLDYGDQPLLVNAGLNLEPGERVCLIGRNGAGKSSTFKLIAGESKPDSGAIRFKNGLAIGELRQQQQFDPGLSVRETVAGGLGWLLQLLEQYQARSTQAETAAELAALETLQRQIEAADGWRVDQRIDKQLHELGLPPDTPMGELSGGWRRRVALARVLLAKPDLLLLDEPTNHLDIQTIRWLEDTLLEWSGCVLFITHDRAFLRRLATRIVELDRGRLISWPGDYDLYLERKEKALEDETRANALFDKKLAGEETWIRQGIKARRTRNEGRARALARMRAERAARLTRSAGARMHVGEGERSGRNVIRARSISYGYGDDAHLIKDFSMAVQRGDRIGFIGNNGVGKSTLLRLLLGDLKPLAGTVKLGTNLEIAYYDQLRNTLDPDKSVAWHIGQGSDFVTVGGRQRHIITYLKDFLFSPQRAASPVGALSGGECNRVVLARLFARPANLLVLDEPTNDLDVETLEVLEDRLINYTGTLLLVSHDRAFLDNVITSSVVFEAGGIVREYVGGYTDWLRQGKSLADVEQPGSQAPAPSPDAAPKAQRARKSTSTKLSYKLQRELDALPERIEELEVRMAAVQEEIAAPDFYGRPYEMVQGKLSELSEMDRQLEALTERWLELDAM